MRLPQNDPNNAADVDVEQVKKMNPECKGMLFVILDMSAPSELFHPDKTGKLSEEEKKLKKCMSFDFFP